MSDLPRILFVTGKLAAPALRRQVAALEAKHGFRGEVAVLPITVAALLTTKWVASHIQPVPGINRVILPGFCMGELQRVSELLQAPVERGPRDLRDLPEYFGGTSGPPEGYGAYDIEILAEINHAPKFSLDEILKQAEHYRKGGAEVIDLGCDPDGPWPGVFDTVTALKDHGYRVSIDSFNSNEVEQAVKAGAELVLSVNGTNAVKAVGWFEKYGASVVAIPDSPSDLQSLEETVTFLERHEVPFRVDPVLEPIGFGFAASLGRYLDCRRRFPKLEMMMGVGNLTELTDADSAGINVLLAGFCQELGIRSVLTTEVGNWCASAVKEFGLARRLVHHAVTQKVLPKKLEPRLVMLRDPKLREHGGLEELAASITDPNYRLFVERGEIHIINKDIHLRGTDAYGLFKELVTHDPALGVSHAFYLGYELAKAVTALTLRKQYTQDRELSWGLLSVTELSHR